MSRKRLALLCVLILLTMLIAWLSARSIPIQSQQLADGSRLKLEAVTYGKVQRFVHGNLWQKLVLQATPKRFLMKQGPWEKFTHFSLQKINGRLITFTPGTDSLVLWTTHRKAKQGWYQSNFIRAEVLDENGSECDMAKMHHVDSGKDYEVTAWELTAFPRRVRRPRTSARPMIDSGGDSPFMRWEGTEPTRANWT